MKAKTTPIVSLVGPSGSGKTTLLAKIVAELKQRGLKVAVIKHSACQVEIDKKGKDSWQFAQAGADAVIVSAPLQWAMFQQVSREACLEELCRMLPEVDIIITEGFHREACLKLEIVPPNGEILSPPDQLLAVISDQKITGNYPCFTRDEYNNISKLLIERFALYKI